MNGMRLPLPFVRQPLLKTPFLCSSLITAIVSLILLTTYFTLQPVVPIFYSLAQPTDSLVPKYWLFVFPIFSVVITAGHFALLRTLREHGQFIQQLFAWTTVVLQVVLAVAFLRIIYIIA